ncbi:MAG: CPBP family intramembrane metalloprotease [Methanobrevibacter sp.]|nr:CPBP family intramembrane metalloprotease [Methanobrevibacter sp.]MBR0370169.1 CPBP family intramembrane metalloprotease [Methanobrevibacter sp.]
MTEKNTISDYITFPKTFENYKWYKPILVFIVGFIIFLILSSVLALVFYFAFGTNFIMSIMNGGYEVMNTVWGQIFTDLGVIILLPSLYLASKIVKDRPFSSYASSRGGWNFKLYLKALVIPFVFIVIAQGIDVLVHGTKGVAHFSILFLIITLILVPIQCITEEFVFRGLIMQALGSWFKIPVLAIILQAIIFAVVHGYNSLGVVEVGISGLLFGILTWKTNGIEVSSAFHTANNLSIALFVMFGLSATSSTIGTYDFIFAIVFDLILFAVIYVVGTKTNWYGEIEESVEN